MCVQLIIVGPFHMYECFHVLSFPTCVGVKISHYLLITLSVQDC